MKLATLFAASVLTFAAPTSAEDNQALTTCKAELAAAWGETLKPLSEGAASDKERAEYNSTLQVTESRIAAMEGLEDLALCRAELERAALRKANAAALQKLLKSVD
jgi:predicted amino acid racemase